MQGGRSLNNDKAAKSLPGKQLNSSQADVSGSGLTPCKLAPAPISPVAKRSVSLLSKHQTESVDKNVTPAFARDHKNRQLVENRLL
jgi:hypothetical protein